MAEEKDTEWSEIISPNNSWFDLRIRELWHYRDLVMIFVMRDFVSIYKQTILGPLWHLIQPLFTTLIFTVVFGKIAKMPTDGIPPVLFYICGVTIWTHFANSLINTANTFTKNASIFGKVYFPRLTVPFSTVISGMMSFGIQFALFIVIYLYYLIQGANIQPNMWLFALPIFILLMAMLGLGCGIIVSALTTKYRDLHYLVGFGVQLFMYATPVIYPMSMLSEKTRTLMMFNPVAPLIEGFRYAFIGQGYFSFTMLIYSTITTLIIFFLGIILFNKVEKTFMDTV